MKTNDKIDQARIRREKRIRSEGFKEGYAAGHRAGTQELQTRFRDLFELEKQGEASRMSDRLWF